MTRTLTTDFTQAVVSRSGEVFYLFELEFSGGTLRYTTAPNDMSWDGHTWTSIGGHLSFESVQESRDLAAQSASLTLDGVNQAVISALLGGNYIGRIAKIYLGHFALEDNLIEDSEDFTQWNLQDVTLAGSQADPFGGSRAYRMTDTNGAVSGHIQQIWAVSVSQICFAVSVKEGTSTTPFLFAQYYDNTAGTTRGGCNITGWTGGKPTVTSYGSSTVLGVHSQGSGWWRIELETAATIVPGNTNRLYIYADTAAGTGYIDIFGAQIADHNTGLAGYAATGGAVVYQGGITADPILIFSGFLNSAFRITETPNQTCKVQTAVVSHLARFGQQRGIRASVTSHQAHYADDTFWRHISGIKRQIWWGGRPLITGGRGGRGSSGDPPDDPGGQDTDWNG